MTAGGNPVGGLLALAGGAVAIVSAWLPWISGMGASSNAIDNTNMAILECGYYLLIGGAVARSGSTVYDGSVRGQLASLGHRLSAES